MCIWTFGAEHEFADWDRRLGVPDGFGQDPEPTIVNSNGIAWAKDWPYGGEFNTPPTETIGGQIEHLAAILEMHPNCVVNYRCNLHVHVRIPGLSGNLSMLKALAKFNREWLPRILPLIEPIPEPTHEEYPDLDAYGGARKRFNRRKVSHQTILGPVRLERQLKATSIKEFHEAEVPHTKKDNKPMFHAQPRAAVNVRQLLQTDTLEFRHFPCTRSPAELKTALCWCQEYLCCFIKGYDPVVSFGNFYANRPWPKFEPYIHDLELGWQATTSKAKKEERDAERAHRLSR